MKTLSTILFLLMATGFLSAQREPTTNPNNAGASLSLYPPNVTGTDTVVAGGKLIVTVSYTVVTAGDYTPFGGIVSTGGEVFVATAEGPLTAGLEVTTPKVAGRIKSPDYFIFFDANPVPLSALPPPPCETDPIWTAAEPSYGNLGQAEIITADWVNTTVPWVDNEVSDTLTIGDFGIVSACALPISIVCINNNELGLGTITCGQVTGSGLQFDSNTFSKIASGFFDIEDMGTIQGLCAGNEIVFLTSGGVGQSFRVGCQVIARTTLTRFTIGSAGQTQLVTLRHGQSCAQGGFFADTNVGLLTDNRSYQKPDANGTFVVSSESPITTINADNFVLTMTHAIMLVDSSVPLAADATFTIDVSSMAVGMPYSIRFVETGSDEVELENAGVNFMTADWRPDKNDILPISTDGTNIYENGARASNRN